MKRVVVAAGLIRGRVGSPHADHFLISQRPADRHLALWWEFPGGKVEPGEAPVDALARELGEELGIGVDVGEIYAVGHHRYEDREILLLVYACRHRDGTPTALDVAELRWVDAATLLATPLPPADAPVLARLAREGAAVRAPDSR